ncbi:hypothetical protein IP87_19910 [beta proteobacterium AAP121]|nr:hypothetical protein IP80_21015 [beta proteobacterium AAP65]KPF93923.1 hypothetical protein IP87_19910 [beta proteobacterium AAP121]
MTPIRTSDKDESDWLATFGDFRLLVEEKTKIENEQADLERREKLARGEVHGSTLPLVHNNRLSGIVRKAAKQLASTASDIDHHCRVVWFTGTGFDAEAKHYQFMATLYGSTKIFELNRPGLKDCYFFRNADFYRFKDQLDGAVVAYLKGDQVTVKLCLNPYAAGWEALRDSVFAANFKLGLIDPVAEEAAGDAYIADTDLDRANPHGIVRFLEQKYALEQAQNMDMHLASALVAMPR